MVINKIILTVGILILFTGCYSDNSLVKDEGGLIETVNWAHQNGVMQGCEIGCELTIDYFETINMTWGNYEYQYSYRKCDELCYEFGQK